MNKLAKTQQPIHELIAKRWSGRAFDPDKTVSQNDLIAMLEAARWAPSCYNEQPWRFIVFDKFSNPDSWNKAFATLAEKNQEWARQAPILILIVANNKFSHNGNDNRWAEYDTGAAVLSLSLQASAMNMTSHQMGGFDEQKARQQFHIPDDFSLMAMMALGYPAPADTLPNDFQSGETGPRSRNNLQENFYIENWGQSLA